MRSFNNYGVRAWSDGYSTFSTLPARSPLVRCPNCPAVFWEEDVATLGEMPRKPYVQPAEGWLLRLLSRWGDDEHGHIRAQKDWDAAPDEWKPACEDCSLELSDLQVALKAVVDVNPARELFVRRRIWWACSDHYRIRIDRLRMSETLQLAASAATSNMMRMLVLHGESEGPMGVERGELLRQLGRFDDAISVLRCVDSDPYTNDTAAIIAAYAEQMVRTVMELRPEQVSY